MMRSGTVGTSSEEKMKYEQGDEGSSFGYVCLQAFALSDFPSLGFS